MPARGQHRRQHRVFVSCADKDRFIARMCAKLIEETGVGRIKAFLYDRDIEGGQSIAPAILSSIRECDEFLF